MTVGTTTSATVTLTNNSGSSVNISQASISGTGFQLSGITPPLTLNASQSTTFTVTFAPQTSGSCKRHSDNHVECSESHVDHGVVWYGNFAGCTWIESDKSQLRQVTVGSKQTLSETVTNTGGSSVTISQVGISGTGFSLSGITAPADLTAGQSATFSVSFTPQSAGAVSGNVTITSTASNPTLTIPLSGTGTTAVGQLTVAPTTLGLGSVVVGTSGTASGSLTRQRRECYGHGRQHEQLGVQRGRSLRCRSRFRRARALRLR